MIKCCYNCSHCATMGCGFYMCLNDHSKQMKEDYSLIYNCEEWEYSDIRVKWWAQVSEEGKKYLQEEIIDNHGEL